jgi:hypothetical protein
MKCSFRAPALPEHYSIILVERMNLILSLLPSRDLVLVQLTTITRVWAFQHLQPAYM